MEENKEKHERNLRFDQRVLNVLPQLLQIGHLKLIDTLTFISLCSGSLFVKQKWHQSLTYKKKCHHSNCFSQSTWMVQR